MTSCPQPEPSMASASGGLGLASSTRCSPCLSFYQDLFVKSCLSALLCCLAEATVGSECLQCQSLLPSVAVGLPRRQDPAGMPAKEVVCFPNAQAWASLT